MKPKDSPFREATVFIEQKGKSRFKIQSDQLEAIGAQLRGPRHFSVFQSIILPLIVTVATLLFTSLFQYVSWYNSVHLENATNVAVNAERAYERAAEAIGRRKYATFVFLPSVRDLGRAAPTIEASTRSGAETIAKVDLKNRKSAKSSPVATTSLEIPLYKSDLDNHRRRFVAYYEQLKFWSENYDHLLTDIDYALDRPVFRQADKEAYRTSSQTLNQINCSKPLTEQLQRLQLDSNSLKLRFAIINKCFIDTNEALSQLLHQAISPVTPVYNESVVLAVNRNLDSIHMKANKFRCYALGRIDYYKAQKELSILSISYTWRWLEDVEKKGALKHFEDTAKYCG